MKKNIYFVLSVVFVILFTTLLVEFILQILPFISRNIPLSNDKTYVYIIGESSSVGEPYIPKISYYKILDYILGNKINDKNIEFIKIAKSGDSIRIQYWKYMLYRYMHPFKRGLAFIYAGKNDWDDGYNNVNKQISKSKIINILYSALNENYDFKYNYEKLIQLIKSFGDDIFVATIEGNYAGFMPHLDNEDILYKNEFDNIDDEILLNGNYDKAIKMLKKLEKKEDSDKSWIYYRYGKIAEFNGEVKKANDYYIKGIGLYSNLIPPKCNIDTIRELSSNYNLPLIDVFDKVYNSGEVIGFNFYKDNQHPDIRLYIIIAELFVSALSRKYDINIEHKNVTKEELYQYFQFDKIDKYNIYRHSLDVTLVHSKENNNVNRYVFQQVDEYLNKIIELNPCEGEQKQAIISFYSMMVEALKGNKEKMLEIYRKNKDIIERNKYEIYARPCDWEEYNKWVSRYLEIDNFFDLSKKLY